MTKTVYCGITFDLITGDQLGEAIERIQDLWGPNWRDDATKRLVMDTFNSCEHFISHYEEAALIKAMADGQKAVRAGIGELLRDMHSGKALGIAVGDEADRLRKIGAA